MHTYLGSILTATVVFPLLAAALLLPYMLYSYRRYGAVLPMRLAVVYAFIYYLLCVYCLAILPFPQEGSVVAQRTRVNLIPFNYVPEILESGAAFSWQDPSTWLRAVYTSGLYEPLLNVVMFVPLGVFLRYYYGCGKLKTWLLALGGSLFLELTQLSATYGLAPFVYRCCDVNDLIGNSLGGLLGYAVTPLLTWILPSRERLNQVSYQRGSRVSYVRRFFAYGVDSLAFGAVGGALLYILPLPEDWGLWAARLLTALLYQGLLPALWQGRTLGKALVKIRLVDAATGETASLGAYCRRGLLLWGLLLGAADVLRPLLGWLPRGELLAAGAEALLWAWVLLAAIRNGVVNQPQMFYERWLGLKQVSTVRRPQASGETAAPEKGGQA